jgi:hypothetical protein
MNSDYFPGAGDDALPEHLKTLTGVSAMPVQGITQTVKGEQT